MEFGVHSESTSPARKRIDEAGRAYQARKQLEAEQRARDHARRLLEVLEADQRSLQVKAEEQRRQDDARNVGQGLDAPHRRAKIVERFEYAYRLINRGTILRSAKTLPELMAEEIARHGITQTDIFTRRKSKGVALIRWRLWHRAKTETNHSYPEIGRFFERDPSTIMHGVRRYEELLAEGGLQSRLTCFTV